MSCLWFSTALLPDGWASKVRLTLADGVIAGVAAGVRPEPEDERHGIGLPGLPNLHSHAFQRGFAGLAERRGQGHDDFWTWRATMYRFLGRMDPDDVEAVAAQAYAEMLEAGFTRVGEFHYLHHAPDGRSYAEPAELSGRIAAAAAETGIGLTLLPSFYAHGGFDTPPTAAQRRFVTDPDGFANLVQGARRVVVGLPGAVVGIAPHSLRAATLAEIGTILPLADGGPVHIHAAEQVAEVDACLAATGRRPVALLLDTLAVDARWCVIHATHMTDEEMAGLAHSGAVAGLCPMTEANLGDGVFPMARFMMSGRFGIGTDSNVLIDAAGELRMLEYAQRLTLRGRNIVAATGTSTGRTLFDRAMHGGAQALGTAPSPRPLPTGGRGVNLLPLPSWEGARGRGRERSISPLALAPGFPADIVALDHDHPALCAASGDALLDAWIFAARTSPIDAVWRAGIRCVSGGRHVRADAIADRFRRTVRRLVA